MKPDCFADLDRVFPLGPDGLRHTPEPCQACGHKVDCLRAALATPQGAAVSRGGRREGPAGRLVQGLARWSRLKSARARGG